MTGSRPDWVSDELYPFESRLFATADGHEMHYVDEGSGPVVVFVHGNPAWSFEFRHLIEGLRSDYRCIAADHIVSACRRAATVERTTTRGHTPDASRSCSSTLTFGMRRCS